MQQAYIAYYGRPADLLGLRFWGARLAEKGGDLNELIAAFGTSAEYTDRFSGLTPEVLVDNLYQNLFNRTAEPDGLRWYLDNRWHPYRDAWAAAHGGNYDGADEYALSQIALDILAGAINDDAVIIANKLEVARYFTQQTLRLERVYDAPDIPAAVALLAGIGAEAGAVDGGRASVDLLMPSL